MFPSYFRVLSKYLFVEVANNDKPILNLSHEKTWNLLAWPQLEAGTAVIMVG
jgi:hypothetical protein